MNRMSTFLRAALSAVILLFISTTASAAAKVVAYVPNWVDLKAFADTIDYAKITHIDVAFENPTNDDGELSFNRQDEFLIAKARAHGVKILVSIGGGSASGDKVLLKRYGHLLADENRAAFVAKIADYLAAHKFDGLDLDIEGPAINKDYGAFVADLAKVLHGKDLLLTAALSQGYGGKKVPDAAFEHFDFVNIMAYDGAGYWDPKTPGQHSSLAFAKSNVAYWLDRGLPKSKAVLGVPFYGYGFGTAFRKRDYAYSEIVAAHPDAENADQAGNTIWYNGIPTIKAKAAYVVEQGLGGVMIWSLDNDVKGERSLLSAIHETLSALAKAAPATKPD
jgi:chitinase